MRLDIDHLRQQSTARIVRFQPLWAPREPGGTLTVHPAFSGLFRRLGLTTAAAFLDLAGEIVSGHPDRHVVRIELPGAAHAFYLKRQHVVGWREKLRNWWAGFGAVSRCEREGQLLQQLQARQLPAPRWAAFGAAGGRAFLLVEEVPQAVELRQLLADNRLSPAERHRLARRLGQALAAVHAAGFTTPELSAKHVWVNRASLAVTFLDWPAAQRKTVPEAERIEPLAALHASVAAELASPRQRLRVLRAYGEISDVARIQQRAQRLLQRRSIRDQRLAPVPAAPAAAAQRLVWLAGEAVCAIPEVAAQWPRPVIAPPFYGPPAPGRAHGGEYRLEWANRPAVLARGRAFAPWGRLRAWWRAVPWRSPGATAARVLFHLERYGLAAPRLLAFGQRWVGRTGAEWFVLYEPVRGTPLREQWTWATAKQRQRLRGWLVEYLTRLHDAGVVVVDPATAFVADASGVALATPLAVRLVRAVDERRRRRDLRRVLRVLGAV